MRRFLALLWFIIVGIMPVQVHANSVLEGSHSVFRIWLIQKASEFRDVLPSTYNYDILAKQFIEFPLVSANGENLEVNRLVCFRYQSDNYCAIGHGTGFFINAHNMITNHHVIDEILQGKAQGVIVAGTPENIKLYDMTIVWSDQNKDLALLDVLNIDASPLSFANEAGIKQTNVVSSIGFPGDSDDVMGFNDRIGFLTPKIRQGTLVAAHIDPSNNVRLWEHNAAISGGNSGGPLVNACSEIVGINNAVHRRNNNILYSIDIRELIPELQRRHVEFDQRASSCATGVVAMSGAIVDDYFIKRGIVFGLLFVLLAILAYVLWAIQRGNRNIILSRLLKIQRWISSVFSLANQRASKRSSVKNSAMSTSPWQVTDDGRVFRYDAVYGLVWKNGHDGKSRSKPLLQNTVFGNAVKAILRVIDHGKVIVEQPLMHDCVLTVGRSKGVDIMVPSKHVSSKHLQVSLQRGVLTVMDLGSTNGSFLNGCKITGSLTVQNNQAIFLGDPKMSLQLNINLLLSSQLSSNLILQPLEKDLPLIQLQVGVLVSVGRAMSNNIVIEKSYISKTHCHLRLNRDESISVKDNGSQNGVFINNLNNRISQGLLNQGDRLYIATKNVAYRVEKIS